MCNFTKARRLHYSIAKFRHRVLMITWTTVWCYAARQETAKRTLSMNCEYGFLNFIYSLHSDEYFEVFKHQNNCKGPCRKRHFETFYQTLKQSENLDKVFLVPPCSLVVENKDSRAWTESSVFFCRSSQLLAISAANQLIQVQVVCHVVCHVVRHVVCHTSSPFAQRYGAFRAYNVQDIILDWSSGENSSPRFDLHVSQILDWTNC